MRKAELYRLAVAACLVLFVVLSVAAILPDGLYEGSD